MKGKLGKAALGLMVLGMIFSAALVHGEDASYWNKFKSVFVDWDDNAPPGSTQTTTVGVRGVNVEEAMGSAGYDWTAVAYMEEFKVEINNEKSFLQEAGLGPFQQ